MAVDDVIVAELWGIGSLVKQAGRTVSVREIGVSPVYPCTNCQGSTPHGVTSHEASTSVIRGAYRSVCGYRTGHEPNILVVVVVPNSCLAKNVAGVFSAALVRAT